MSLTLYTYPGNPRAFKALIAAEYAGVKIDVPEFKIGTDNKTKEFLLDVNPLGKVPALSTPEGSVFESNAIARYVARAGAGKNDLYGATPLQAGQIDQWMDFASNELELPIAAWCYPILGAIPENKDLTERARADLGKGLAILDKHLLYRTFLVGERVSLADIVVACTVYLPFAIVLDAKARQPYGNVVRWFDTLVHQKEFAAVLGDFKLCDKPRFVGDGLGYAMGNNAPPAAAGKKGGDAKKAAAPAAAAPAAEQPKKEKKKAEKKEAAPAPAAAAAAPAAAGNDDDEDAPPPKPKEKNPLDLLPATPFVLDEFKRLYSNAKDTRSILTQFWEMYDNEGWCWYECKYKFNDELTKLFMTSNLVGGFLQRLDKLRKYGFGNMLIFGKEPKMQVSGCWLFRGQEIPPEMTECDDSAWYTWRKMDSKSDADRALIADYMCWEGKFGGNAVVEASDGKTFK